MASGKTLNAANLEALGAAQLAALLIEISKGNAAAQRRLRLALAGSGGPAEAARAVLMRLASISRAKTWLGWQKIKPFVADLESQHRAILDLVAPTDPREAFELIWRLVGCADGVLARSDDGGGRLAATFHAAARELGPLAEQAGMQVEELAERAFRALAADRRGIWDELIPTLTPRLGRPGLTMIKELLQAEQPVPRGRIILQQIADALGDVDFYIALFGKPARRLPAVAAAIARRLLDAGRALEALAALEVVDAKFHGRSSMEFDDVRLEVLEALGRSDEAQAFRWERFSATLDAASLRAYLRKLPDFDDFDAEQRALAQVVGFADVHHALGFLVAWPDLRRASDLVLGRSRSLNGDLYELLTPAAEALDSKYPLAAVVLYRVMIDFTVRMARSTRYKHAARLLTDCRAAAARVVDFGRVLDQPAYERTLQAGYARRAAFWQAVG